MERWLRNRRAYVLKRRRAISSTDTSYHATSNDTGRLEVQPLSKWHFNMLDIQDSQSWLEDYIPDRSTYATTMIDAGPAFALVDGTRVLGIAGVWEIESHRANAWAVIDRQIGTDYIHFHKAVKSFIERSLYQRIEMAVEVDFKQAKRWAEMLGFKQEGFMHKYFANGSDAFLYARVK